MDSVGRIIPGAGFEIAGGFTEISHIHVHVADNSVDLLIVGMFGKVGQRRLEPLPRIVIERFHDFDLLGIEIRSHNRVALRQAEFFAPADFGGVQLIH